MQKPDPDTTCPATMHSDKCMDHFMNCPKWVNVQGQHPQTGSLVDQYACLDTWMPILLIENSQQQRGTQKAVESLRNIVDRDNQQILSLADKRITKLNANS